MRPISILGLLATLVGPAACGDDGGGSDPDASAPTPDAAAQVVTAELGGLTVRVTDAPAQIEILDPNGDPLLTGLPGGAVPADGAPHAAAASRTSQVDRWEQVFGSYRVMLADPGEWQGVERFADVASGADAVTFDVGDGAGSGEIRRVAEHTLRVSLTVPADNRVTMAFRCGADEHFLGFGAQPVDVDHRGHTFPLFVSEQGNGRVLTEEQPDDNWYIRGTRHQTSFPVPFFISSAGYGILADTDYRSVFSMCEEADDVWRLEVWDDTVAFHLFYGPEPLDVAERHTDLVGRPPVPPAFAFAPWNDAVGGSAEVRRVAQTIRDEDIPSSVIWTEDWAGSSGDTENLFLDQNWSVSRDLYPDFETLADELHAAGFKFLGYFSSFAYQDKPSDDYVSDHFQEGVDNGYFVQDDNGDAYTMPAPRLTYSLAVTDLTDPAARDWVAGYMHAALDLGLDGWMADYGEWMPVDGVTEGDVDPLAYHNRYPVAWQEINERVFDERTDGVERLFFVRSGYTGSQAIGHQLVWGADQATSFERPDGLPSTIPIGIGLGVSGLPYYGPDIAGYAEWTSANEGLSPDGTPTTKELFFRWTSAAALMPIMRTHHGRDAANNWHFDTDADTIAHFRRWARLHIQLYPYFAVLAQEASQTGAPLMRGLALVFPDDLDAWPVTDQFLLGPAILVAPVVTEGATSRDVYFPAATWIPLEGGTPVIGPTTETVAAPREDMPVYARAGTVLALLPEAVDSLAPATDATVVTRDDVGTDREVRAYLGADGSFSETGSALTYELLFDHEPTAGATLSWGGTALPACDADPVPPCGDVDEAGRTATAVVTGDDALILDDGTAAATLTTAGGDADRQLVIHLYW